MTEDSGRRWRFALDEDGDVLVRGDGSTPEDVRRALELLVLPFGANAWVVEDYLRVWHEFEAESVVGYSLNTPAAMVSRLGTDVVRVSDRHGDEAVLLEVADFVGFLRELARYLRSLED